MILAGLDEAGYGPILGPLSVARCAVRLPQTDTNAPADLWQMLRRIVAKKRDRTGRKLHVNDSKQVYSPATGLAELERSVLAWIITAGHQSDQLEQLLSAVAPTFLDQLPGACWYDSFEAERHPASADRAAVAIAANALREECRRLNVELLLPRVELLLEAPFNKLTTATRNKSSVLFTLAAAHIDALLREHAHEGLYIVCDRHGGRSRYGPLLRLMFAEWDLTILDETEARADYLLAHGDRVARLSFVEKADTLCLPTAMASMIAKYARERLMARFNAFWRRHAPELKPTAGYWSDGLRFLADIGPLRKRFCINDDQLIRQR